MKKIYLVIIGVLMMMLPKSLFAQYAGVGTFNQISSLADITDGYYVIATGSTFAMNNSYVGSTYLDRTAITPLAGVITNPATSIVWKVETNAGGRTIFNETTSQFISYTGTSNNVQVVSSVAGNNQRWTFAYTGSGSLFTITNIAVNTRLLQYNSGAPRFACYTGSQTNLTLYKLAVSPNKYWDVSAGLNNGVGGNGTWGSTFSTTASGDATLTTASSTDDVIYNATAGTVTLNANQTVRSHTFNVSGYILATTANSTLAGTIALGSNLVTLAPGTSNNLSLPGVISGTGGLTQNGAGTTILSGSNTYTGNTSITAGTLSIGAADRISNSSNLILGGGTFSTGGFGETLGTVALTDNSTIALGTGVHNLNFANSNAVAWTGSRTLSITGWTGTAGASGTAGKIFVGVGGLTGTQLAQISFTGYTGTPVILGTGEIVPPNNSPSITVSASTLSGFTYIQNNGPSASQTYNVSGSNLTPASGNINIAASTNYEVSTDNVNFSTTSINIAYTGSALASTAVYVRLKAGLNVGVYNSENIVNTGGGASARNVTASGNVTSSASSNIIDNGDNVFYTSNIPYINWQATTITNTNSNDVNGSIGIFRFNIQDGAGTADGDNLPTIVTGLTFNYVGSANTIRSAAIFDGNGKVADVTTVNANSLVFSGIANAVFNVPDNGSKVLTLRVSFTTTVTDNQKLQFQVSNALTASSSTSSQFAASNAGGATSDNLANDRNRIEVTADRIRFTTQPSDQSVNTNLASFTIAAVDQNANLDLDAVNVFSLTTSGVGLISSSPYTLSSGVRSITDVQFTSTQGPITLTATSTGLSFDNDDISASFNISDVTTGTYRTTGAGTWPNSGTATWERFNAGWNASSSPAANTTDLLIIRHAITSNAAFAALGGVGTKMTVESGGTFTGGHNCTFSNLLVNSGGRFIITDPAVDILATTGRVTVESGGTISSNSATFNTFDGFWEGIEDFKSGSTFEILNWDWDNSSAGERLIDNDNSISQNSGGYYFGNIVFSSSPVGKAFTLVGVTGTQRLCSNDLVITNGSATLNVILANVNANVEIGGNVIVNQNTFSFGSVTASNITQLVKGNIVCNAGTINLNQTNSGSASVLVNLEGNLSILSSASLVSTDQTCKIIFSKAGLQTVSIAGTLGTNVGFDVSNGSTTQLINQNLSLTNASNRFSVLTGGILEFNGFDVLGNGDFILSSGGSLKITSANGVNASPTNTGNVRNAGTRTFDQAGYYYYVGAVTPQATGTAMANAGSTGKRIFIEKSNATDIVNLTQSTATSDQLTINTGIFNESPTATITGGGDLNMGTSGRYRMSIPNVSLPQLTGTYNLIGSSTIELNGTANQILKGSRDYRNLHFSNSGIKTLTSGPSSITGTITVSDNAILDVNNNGMGSSGTNLTMTENSIYRNSGSNVKPDPAGTYSLGPNTTIEFYGTAGTSIRLGSPVIQYGKIIVSGKNVSNPSAVTGIRFQTGGTFTVKDTAIFKVFNTNGFSGSTSTAIDNTNNPSIILEPLSTVEYAATGNQTISNSTVTSPASSNYASLKIAGTGIKTAPSGTLSIQDSLTKTSTSTFNNNNGLVLLNGTTQSFAGLEFYGLELSGGTKTTNGNASIADVVKINSNAVLNIAADETITLKSTATKTARIDQLLHATPADAITYNGSGKFIVERALINSRKWRLLAAPTSNGTQTIKNSWQENSSYVPGYGFKALDTRADWLARGFDGFGNNSSVKQFNTIAETWDAVSNTNVLPISNQRGYMVFVSGDFNTTFPNSNPTNLRTAGQLYTGTRPVINIPAASFAVIGNPYASRINLREVNFSVGTGVEQAVYVWDPTLTSYYGLGAFNTLSKDIVTGDYKNLLPSATYGAAGTINNFIESGQAFMVRAFDASTITFDEQDKTDGSTLINFTAGDPQSIIANLHLVPSGGAPLLLDGVRADFSENFSNNLNSLDIKKMATFNESVSWKSKDSLIVIDRRAMIVNNDTLHLQNSNYKVQNYQWEIISNNLDFPGRIGFLIDRYLNTVTPLNMAGTTTVNFSVQNIPGAYAADRFKIVFNQAAAGPLPVTFTTVTANRNADRTVAVQWKVEQEINIESYEVERSHNGSNFSSVHNRTATGNNSSSVTYDHIDLTPFSADNFYRIKATSVGGQVQYSNIVKLSGIKATSLISVYPNPVLNKQMQLRFDQQEKGNYQVQLMNMKGQVMVNKTINVVNTVQMANIDLSASLAAGNYQLLVTAPNGTSTKQTVLVQ